MSQLVQCITEEICDKVENELKIEQIFKQREDISEVESMK